MLKVGVVGCGHLGKIHTKLLSQSKNYKLIGIYDKDNEESIRVSDEFKCTSFESFDSLLDSVDVIDIVAPTPFNFNYAKQAINKNKHVFIEKPVCTTSKESEELIKLGDLKKVKIQVGHVERFNPAFTKVESEISKPMFIESHRLAKFNPRGTDVSVVLDLMIHDIDIILKTVDSKVKDIFKQVKWPPAYSVFDYYYDLKKDKQFKPWSNKVAPFIYDKEASYFDLMVPTTDTTKYAFSLDLLIALDKPVFFTGNSGVGESAVISNKL